MAINSPKIPVAFVALYDSLFALDYIQGFLDYADRIKRWRLVTPGYTFTTPFPDLDLVEVAGVVGFFYDAEEAAALTRAGVAAVSVSTVNERVGLPCVVNDDFETGRCAARHLLDRGLNHFAYKGFNDTWFSRRRLEGFTSGLAEAGRAVDVVDASTSHETPEDMGPIGGWLRQLPRPTGVFAATDFVARGVIGAAVQEGLRVPQDLAVVGVNNDRFQLVQSPVPMSSVEFNAARIGYRAAEMLDRLLCGDSPDDTEVVLPPRVVVARESTDLMATDDPVVSHALQFIKDHCHEPITVEDLLDEVGVSRRGLERRLKSAVGETPHVLLSRFRVERAKHLLTHSTDSTERIAEACGFERQDRFFIVFKRVAGMTPGEFRRRFSTAQW